MPNGPTSNKRYRYAALCGFALQLSLEPGRTDPGSPRVDPGANKNAYVRGQEGAFFKKGNKRCRQ